MPPGMEPGTTREGRDSPPDEGPPSGWLGGVQTLVLSFVGLLGDGLELLSLELQRGLRLLERLLWLMLLGAAALFTAWLFFWIGLAVVLTDAGMMWPLACAIVVLGNAGVLAMCLSQARLLRPMFAMPALRRQMGLGSEESQAEAARAQAARDYAARHGASGAAPDASDTSSGPSRAGPDEGRHE
ncbi:hypothetical protein [Roseateles flavus]|uniref:Phage holin family protein n=1 Tax=Roseateles flavus TaxID=3149041 RepID=A0ABV0GGM0_9BURK